MTEQALTDIADELYALTPSDFTPARNARARQLRGIDRDLALAVSRLPKPAAAAWAVNLLVRRRPEDIGAALELGARLRDAQTALDAAALRRLSKERRDCVAELVEAAVPLAAEEGVAISAAARAVIEQTLTVALLDERAADAVRTARLVRGLESTGGERVDLTDAVGGPFLPTPSLVLLAGGADAGAAGGADAGAAGGADAGAAGGADASTPDASGPETRAPDAESKQQHERARRAAARSQAREELKRAGDVYAEAVELVAEANHDVESARRDRDDAAEELHELQERMERLQRRIDAARRDLKNAEDRFDAAQGAHEAAISERRRADRARQEAESALESL